MTKATPALLRLRMLMRLLIALPVVLLSLAPTAAQVLDLRGELRLNHARDEPVFAMPDYDDSAWIVDTAPSSARRSGVPDAADVIWYRITFSLPRDWAVERPALEIGLLQRADETYLNGVLIGGEGTVGRRGTAWHNYPPVLPRLYAFDRDLLVSDASNVLAVRVARQPFSDEAGLIAAPIAIVDAASALPAHFARLQRLSAIDSFVFGLEVALLLGLVAALALGTRDRALLLFAAVYLLYFAFRLEQRHVVHAIGVDSAGLQYAATLLASALVVPLISFVAVVLQRPVGALGRFIQIGALACLVSFPLATSPAMTWWHVQSILLWHVLLALGLGLLTWWAIEAWRRGDPKAVPLGIGMAVMAGTIIADLILPSFWSEVALGLRRGDIGILLFLIALGGLAAMRMIQTRRELSAIRASALIAQEAERNRLPRDVHDGIGQWLSGIKFKLEVLASGLGTVSEAVRERAEGIVDEVDLVIEDTRRIAHDLSPALLDKLGLLDAMKSHAGHLSTSAGVAIDVEGDPRLDLPPPMKGNVYRFFQETLNNAVSHSDGTRMSVSLRRMGDAFVLTLMDDGKGIDPREAGGLGLRSMQERARLMGGTVSIDDVRSGGTRVTLRAPLATPARAP